MFVTVSIPTEEQNQEPVNHTVAMVTCSFTTDDLYKHLLLPGLCLIWVKL